jgi:ankyrin repeat protein
MNYTKYAKYVFLVLFVTSTFTHAEDINSGMKTVIDIANTTIQLGISDLKKEYKDKLEILYEDMSRKGQLNGTHMLGRLSKLCLNEIDDCVLLIHNTLLRVVKNSGVSYSDELAADLENIVKSHLTGEIGNISGYIKQKNKFGPTLTNQLSIKEMELNNKRTNELKKINSEIDLLAISLKNQEKQLKRPDFSNSSWLSSTFNISKIIWWVLSILGTIIAGFIIHHYIKSPHQGQKPDASSSFQDRLSFIEAAKEGNVSAIELLLDKGVDVNTIDRDGNTALILAARYNQRACIQKLLEKGSNVDTKNTIGWTALMIASQNGYKTVAELLIKNDADVNAKANDGNTAFTFASYKDYNEIVDILKKSGAVLVKYQDMKILTASLKGDISAVKALLEKGVSPNTVNQFDGKTPLMCAMGQNRFECAKLLLEFGADVNIKAKDGHTVLDDIKSKPEMSKLIEIYGTKRQ